MFWNFWNTSLSLAFQIDQGDLGMPSADYFTSKEHEDKLNAYKKFAENVAITLGASSSEAKKQIDEAIKLEIQIANVMYLMHLHFPLLLVSIMFCT